MSVISLFSSLNIRLLLPLLSKKEIKSFLLYQQTSALVNRYISGFFSLSTKQTRCKGFSIRARYFFFSCSLHFGQSFLSAFNLFKVGHLVRLPSAWWRRISLCSFLLSKSVVNF